MPPLAPLPRTPPLAPLPRPPPLNPGQEWGEYVSTVKSVYSTAAENAAVGEYMMNQRIQQVLQLLGVLEDQVKTSATFVPYLPGFTVVGRRKLYRVTEPLVSSSCYNGTTVLVTAEIRTDDEALNTLFVRTMSAALAQPLTNLQGHNFTVCSTSQVDTNRLIIASKQPPSSPPPPFIAEVVIANYGRGAVAAGAGFLFICGCIGQWLFVPFMGAAPKKKQQQKEEEFLVEPSWHFRAGGGWVPYNA
jgi:hypothetical protein